MNKKKHIIIFIFCIILVLASVFINRKSDSKNGDKLIYYGYPLGFIEQNFYDYKYATLYYQNFDLEREETSYKIVYSGFVLSVFIVFVGLEILIYILEVIDFRARTLLLKIIAKYKK
jgi:hypothetical protein